MQVLLRIANGKTNVRKVRLQSDTIIGRSPECQLKVASNQISRRHCQILIRDGFVAIRDLGSANGTFVNGRRVPPEVDIPLTPGTRVMLGPLHFTVDYEPVAQLTVAAVPAQEAAVDTVTTASQESVAAAQPQARLQRGEASAQSTRQSSPPQDTPQSKAAAAKPDDALSTTASNSLSDTAYMNPPAQPVAGRAGAMTPPAGLPTAGLAGQPPVTAPQPEAVANPQKLPTETSDHDFHFGIFAASGSNVVVESAPEIPMVRGPVPVSLPVKGEKAEKKGFFQMLGWGKKDPAKASIVGEANADKSGAIQDQAGSEAADDTELVAGPEPSDHSFDILIDDEPVLDPEGSGSGQDLNSFFNSRK